MRYLVIVVEGVNFTRSTIQGQCRCGPRFKSEPDRNRLERAASVRLTCKKKLRWARQLCILGTFVATGVGFE